MKQKQKYSPFFIISIVSYLAMLVLLGFFGPYLLVRSLADNELVVLAAWLELLAYLGGVISLVFASCIVVLICRQQIQSPQQKLVATVLSIAPLAGFVAYPALFVAAGLIFELWPGLGFRFLELVTLLLVAEIVVPIVIIAMNWSKARIPA